MKRPAFHSLVLLTVLAAALPLVADPSPSHPAEETFARLKKAQANYSKAEKGFLAAVAGMDDLAKRDQTLKAFKERKAAWEKLSDADANLKVAASPLPEISTNSGLVSYRTEIRYLDLQTAQLIEQEKWLREAWK